MRVKGSISYPFGGGEISRAHIQHWRRAHHIVVAHGFSGGGLGLVSGGHLHGEVKSGAGFERVTFGRERVVLEREFEDVASQCEELHVRSDALRVAAKERVA